MGKAGKQKKRRREEQQQQQQHGGFAASGASDEEGDGRPSTEQIEEAARVIDHLACNAGEFGHAAFRPLRTALHKLMSSGVWQGQASGGAPPSKHEQISSALRVGDWAVAVGGLREMYQKKIVPKLGTLQRWVRECDGVFTEEHLDEGSLTCLDAILRAADPGGVGIIRGSFSIDNVDLPAPDTRLRLIEQYEDWDPISAARILSKKYIDIEKDIEPGTTKCPCGDADCCYFDDTNPVTSTVCAVIPASERTPPNKYDLRIHSTSRRPLRLHDANHFTNKHRREVYPCQFVSGAFLVKDLLQPWECRRIIDMAEKFGYDPDEAATGSAVEKNSVLAHACVWLADEQLTSELWQRAKKAGLPANCEGAVGLNRRFRCYRYRPGSVYRPHIDGAWPPSGETMGDDVAGAEDGYIYDASGGAVLSKFTFLIYLNQDFTGGGTTFYAASARKEGVLERRSVKPRTGSALVFPHGANSAALHEGSEVSEGAKYVIRTEILFPI